MPADIFKLILILQISKFPNGMWGADESNAATDVFPPLGLASSTRCSQFAGLDRECMERRYNNCSEHVLV